MPGRLNLPPPGASWRDYDGTMARNRARKTPANIRSHNVSTKVYKDRVELDPYDLLAVCVQYDGKATYSTVNSYTDALADRIRAETGISRVRRNFSEQAMEDVIHCSKSWYKKSSSNTVVAGSAFDWDTWLNGDRDKSIQQLMLDTAGTMFGGNNNGNKNW